MKKTRWLLVSLAAVATLGLACGDDTEPLLDSGVPDQVVYQDTTNDAPPWADTVPWVDTMQPDQAVDMAVNDDMTADAGADMVAETAPPDAAGDTSTADTSTTDTSTTADSGPSSSKCTSPTVLTLPSSGTITVSGDTAGAANEFGTTIKCGTSFDFDGSQVYYQIALQAKKYLITLNPTTSWDPALYIFKDKTCTAATIDTECAGAGGAAADDGTSGQPEVIAFTPAAAGDFIIAADTFSATATGKFTLTIEEAKPPTNDACTGAKALHFINNTLSESGTTLLAQNDVKLTSTGCTGNTTDGPDVFFKIDLTAGSSYKLELDGSGFDEVLYIFTNCASVASTCGTGMGADDWTSSSEELTFKPTTSSTYYIGVSGKKATDSGSFTLTIDEFPPITNDTCATAKTITMTSGKGTANGHTIGATNTVNLPSTGCTGDDTEGGDVWHKVTLTANKDYLITSLSGSGYNHAIYILSSCTNPTTACLKGADDASSASTEKLTFKPTTTGTYYIAVDTSYATTSSYAAGSYDLTVEEFVPAANDTCATAQVVTLTAGKATVTGSKKANASNWLGSCGSDAMAASDLFYRFTPVVGKKYKVTFKPLGSGGRFGVWDGSHNCVASAVSTACGTLGYKYVSGSSSDSTTITSAAGDVYFVADGLSAGMYDIYDFSFEIEEVP